MELKFKEYSTLLPITFVCILMVCLYLVEIKFGIEHLFFPEIAALSFGVLSRKKTWHIEKSALLLSPVACASLGVLLSRYFGTNFVTLSACLIGGLILLRVFNTNITPSISAGLFALLFNINTFSYVLNIFVLSLVLLLMSQILERYEKKLDLNLCKISDRKIESKFGIIFIVMMYFGFSFVSQKYYIPEVLLPPIFVLAIEECSEIKLSNFFEILKFSIWIILVSYFAFGLKLFLGLGPLAIFLSILFSLFIFKISKLQAPPLLALALLPLILEGYSQFSPLATGFSFIIIMLSLSIFRKTALNTKFAKL